MRKSSVKKILCFFSLFLFYICWGIAFSYLKDKMYISNDTFYDMDPRVDLFFAYDTASLEKHLFIYLFTPFVKIINYIIQNDILTLLLLQSATASFNVFLLYKLLKKLNVKKYTSLLFSLIYAFSFSTLMFTVYIESYIFSSCIGLLFTNYIISHKGKQFSLLSTFIVSLLYILGFGINFINCILYIPLITYFIINQPTKDRLKSLGYFLLFASLFSSIFYIYEEIFWNITYNLFYRFSESRFKDMLHWITTSQIKREQTLQIFKDTLIAPFYALSTQHNPIKTNEISYFSFISKINDIYTIPFLTIILFPLYKLKKIQFSNLTKILMLIVFMHLNFNFFWAASQTTWFLYSHNYFFCLIAVLAVYWNKIDKKQQYIILIPFLIIQIFLNLRQLTIFIPWTNSRFLHEEIFSIKNIMPIIRAFFFVVCTSFAFIQIKKNYKFLLNNVYKKLANITHKFIEYIKNKRTIIFSFLFLFYFCLGAICSYFNTNFALNLSGSLNAIYDMDLYKKLRLLFLYDTYDLDRHPLILFLTPLVKAINYIIQNEILTLLLLQSVLASFNVFLLYNLLKKLNVKKYTSLLFSLIYTFSFSTLLFTAYIECYIYSSFFGLLLTNYIVSHKGKQFSLSPILIISLLYILNFGINFINCILYIPLIAYFIVNQPIKYRLKSLGYFLLFATLYFAIFYIYEEIFFSISNSLFLNNTIKDYRAFTWINKDQSIIKSIQVLKETLIAPFYALPTNYKDPNFIRDTITWSFSNKINIVYIIPFLLITLFPLYKFKEIQFSALTKILISIVFIHLCLNFFYNKTWFLYSQNYFFCLITVLAVLWNKINKQQQDIVLIPFLILQIFLNFRG